MTKTCHRRYSFKRNSTRDDTYAETFSFVKMNKKDKEKRREKKVSDGEKRKIFAKLRRVREEGKKERESWKKRFPVDKKLE